MTSNFVDYVKIFVRSGKGGAGSAHLLRVKYNAKAGPDGGDGGRGAATVILAMGAGRKATAAIMEALGYTSNSQYFFNT